MERCGRCVKAFLWRVVIHIHGSCTICILPVRVMQKEGGGRAQLRHPRRTESSHISCACSAVPFAAVFHSQFWALAVKVLLCKLFCLVNLGSHLMLAGGPPSTCLHTKLWSSHWSVHDPRAIQTFPQAVQWCLVLTWGVPLWEGYRQVRLSPAWQIFTLRWTCLRPTKLKGRFAQWITLE